VHICARPLTLVQLEDGVGHGGQHALPLQDVDVPDPEGEGEGSLQGEEEEELRRSRCLSAHRRKQCLLLLVE